MVYKEITPSPALSAFIDCYWTYRANPVVKEEEQSFHHCLPLGTVELITYAEQEAGHIWDARQSAWVKSYDALFTGLYTGPALWKPVPGSIVRGIRMKPEALRLFFGVPAAELFNTWHDAQAVMGSSHHRLLPALYEKDAANYIATLERFFLSKLVEPATHRNYVSEACDLLRRDDGSLAIEDLSDQLYVSRRQLERSFKEALGTTPKLYQRIIRFRKLYQHIKKQTAQPLRWAAIAYGLGYADQAHLIRDCKAFSGLTPAGLAQPNHRLFQICDKW